MTRIKRSLLGFWVLIGIVVFHLVFLYITYRNLKNIQGFSFDRLPLRFLIVEFIVVAVLAAEIITYWSYRYKIRNKWWVRLHVWPLFSFMVLFPLLILFFNFSVARHYGSEMYYSFSMALLKLRSYLFWIVVPGSHIFFIITIVQGFKPVKQPVSDEAPGLLDEFIN
jgi:hypothetical protein